MTNDLENRFVHHPPTPERVGVHERIREELLMVAEFLDRKLPDGREKSLALTKLEEAMFWANAAVARQGE